MKKHVIVEMIICYIAFIPTIVVCAINDMGFWKSFIISILVLGGLIYVFVKIDKYFCPNCSRLLSMREVERFFVEEKLLTRDVDVRDTRWITINGKRNMVTEYHKERQYANVAVYNCVEECKHCGTRRNVEKYEPLD